MILRLIRSMGWRPLFLFIRAYYAYSLIHYISDIPLNLYWIYILLDRWIGALSSHPFIFISPNLWLSGLIFILY